jgi:hypothetical protein
MFCVVIVICVAIDIFLAIDICVVNDICHNIGCWRVVNKAPAVSFPRTIEQTAFSLAFFETNGLLKNVCFFRHVVLFRSLLSYTVYTSLYSNVTVNPCETSFHHLFSSLMYISNDLPLHMILLTRHSRNCASPCSTPVQEYFLPHGKLVP